LIDNVNTTSALATASLQLLMSPTSSVNFIQNNKFRNTIFAFKSSIVDSPKRADINSSPKETNKSNPASRLFTQAKVRISKSIL